MLSRTNCLFDFTEPGSDILRPKAARAAGEMLISRLRPGELRNIITMAVRAKSENCSSS